MNSDMMFLIGFFLASALMPDHMPWWLRLVSLAMVLVALIGSAIVRLIRR